MRSEPILVRVILATALVIGGIGRAGCASRSAGTYAVYPVEPVRGRTLDVQVFREGRYLELTNTTTGPLENTRLWINARFSIALDPIGVGERRVVPLAALRDRHGEAFRAGGFWATERPDPVVLAEIERGGVFERLVVVRDRAD